MNITNDHTGRSYPYFWDWTMRSDKPSATNAVTSGTLYWTPLQHKDRLAQIFASFGSGGTRFKFSHTVSNNLGGAWTLTLYMGLYRLQKGLAATAGFATLTAGVSLLWSGTNNLAATTRYNSTGALSAIHVTPNDYTDGTYMIGLLWSAVASGFGATHTVTAYGANVSSGTWLHAASDQTGLSALPATIASISSTAKIFNELFINEE